MNDILLFQLEHMTPVKNGSLWLRTTIDFSSRWQYWLILVLNNYLPKKGQSFSSYNATLVNKSASHKFMKILTQKDWRPNTITSCRRFRDGWDKKLGDQQTKWEFVCYFVKPQDSCWETLDYGEMVDCAVFMLRTDVECCELHIFLLPLHFSLRVSMGFTVSCRTA